MNMICDQAFEFTLDRNVLDGKAENDGPDHSKSHFYIAVNNFWKRNMPSAPTIFDLLVIYLGTIISLFVLDCSPGTQNLKQI